VAIVIGGLWRSGLQPATAYPRSESFACDSREDTTFGRMVAAESARHPGKSGFRLLANGMEAFLMRAVLAELAERTLDLQYYIFRNDDTGGLLTEALIHAADRGVRVRLLVDDLNLVAREDEVSALDSHPGIEVRIFNPFIARAGSPLARLAGFLAHPVRLNRRMHNKSFIADNQCAIVGGRNIGDEYFDANRDFGFGDLDVFAVGPVTHEISASFDVYWNSAFAYPLGAVGFRASATGWMDRLRARLSGHLNRMRETDYAKGLRETDLAKQLIERRLSIEWARAKLIVDVPEKVEGRADSGALPIEQLRALAEKAAGEVILVSPYFVPGREGVTALCQLRSRGVRVRILTNSLASSDVAAVHAGYSRYRAALLEGGIEIHEFKPILPTRRKSRRIIFGSAWSSLHAKIYVFDRKRAIIGSLNLDPRSVYLNTELALDVDSSPLAGQIAEAFEELIQPEYSYRVERNPDGGGLTWTSEDDDGEVTYFRDPQASIWRRLAVVFLRMLPIEDQL
jgi:putative cardiolipin synthase